MRELCPYTQGYIDGGDPDCPEPGDNADPRYVHSFWIRRNERAGIVTPAPVSRRRVNTIEAERENNKLSHTAK